LATPYSLKATTETGVSGLSYTFPGVIKKIITKQGIQENMGNAYRWIPTDDT
jgi:hypothetical protein